MFFLSLLIVLLIVAGMSVGVLAGRPPIKGSCGGIGALGIDTECDICGGDPNRCDEDARDGEEGSEKPGLYYPADR